MNYCCEVSASGGECCCCVVVNTGYGVVGLKEAVASEALNERIDFLEAQVDRLQRANTEEVERRCAAEIAAKKAYPQGYSLMLEKSAGEALDEAKRAAARFPPFSSAHEAFMVLYEEVDELWEEVRKNPTKGEPRRIRFEAMQVAAMALRMMVEVDS